MANSLEFEPRFLRDFRDFETAAADWMRCWGFCNVELTRCGPDGGVDVKSVEAVAQVKAWTVPVGSPAVQQLKGVAHDGLIPIFFSLSEYTSAAIAFADEAEVALFRFTGYDGAVGPINQHAQQLLASLDDKHPKQEQRSKQSTYYYPIFKLVANSIDKMLNEPKGVGLFTVKKNGNSIQLHWENDKEIKLVMPQTKWGISEVTILGELGWNLNSDRFGTPQYFFFYFIPPFPVKHIERLMTKTLIDVNGVSSPYDVEVTIEMA